MRIQSAMVMRGSSRCGLLGLQVVVELRPEHLKRSALGNRDGQADTGDEGNGGSGEGT
jgi:hypothetical protein